MRDYHRLKVWARAHSLALGVYEATRGFPGHEAYGLTNQLRRASVSIPSNLAEGCGRDGSKELLRYVRIAQGSASEVEYQILLARDLGYLDEARYNVLRCLSTEVLMMLNGLQRAIKKRLPD